MDKVAQAKKVRAQLLASRPAKRSKLLRTASEDLNLNDYPDAKIAMACVDGLGPTGARELVTALGLWLAANDITEHPITE